MTATPILWDSFDMYNGFGGNQGLLSRWRAVLYDPAGISFGANRYPPGQSLQINNYNGSGQVINAGADLIIDPTATMAHCTVHFAFNVNTLVKDECFMVLKDQNMNPQISLGHDILGRWYVATGRQGAKFYTASLQPDNANIFNLLAVEVVVASGSGGTVNLWANGVNLGGVTGINTNPTGQGNVSVIEFYNFTDGANKTSFLIDDLYITNGTYLDECRCETVRAIVDILTGWVPNSGANNYSRINETLVDGDTSYVSTATSGARDLYGVSSLSSNPYNIYGANVVSFGYKTDATTRQFYNSMRSAGIDSDGPSFNLAGNYRRFDRPVLLNPATGLAWTAADINNLQIGPKMV